MTMGPKLLMKRALYQIRHRLAQKAQYPLADVVHARVATFVDNKKFLYWLYPDTPRPVQIGGQGS